MIITSIDEAFKILDDNSRGELERVKAIRYITDIAEEQVIDRLVKALQDEDFGVRWAASSSLARLGEIALPGLLKALMDPDLVGDRRLRQGVIRALKHMKLSPLPPSMVKLLEALQGPAAAIVSMKAAYKVWADLGAKSN